MATIGSQRIVFEGVSGTIRLGYQRAARLGAWRIEGGYLSAAVLEVDGFRITQSGLVLELTYPEGAPTYRPIGDVAIAAGRLTARLLPKT